MKDLKFKKSGGLLAIFGAAAAICSSFMLPASAALDGGGFKIHAENIDTPSIWAEAGSNALKNGSTSGGTNPGNAVLASYPCGPETFTYTQSMKDLTDANKALHAANRDSEMTKGPGGWEAVNVLDGGALFGPGSTIIAVGSIAVAEASEPFGFLSEISTGYSAYYSTPSNAISGNMAVHGHNSDGVSYMVVTPEICQYAKQINGKLSTSNGSPAYLSIAKDPNMSGGTAWTSLFARDGQFYRPGGKPQVESTVKSASKPDSVVVQLTYPAGRATETAGNNYISSAEKPYTVTPTVQ